LESHKTKEIGVGWPTRASFIFGIRLEMELKMGEAALQSARVPPARTTGQHIPISWSYANEHDAGITQVARGLRRDDPDAEEDRLTVAHDSLFPNVPNRDLRYL
jgi:hypothetical protein